MEGNLCFSKRLTSHAVYVQPWPIVSCWHIPRDTQASNLEADKQGLQRRCADVEDLADRRRRQSEEARDRLQDALEELSRLKEACSGKDRIALEARAEAKHAAERLAAEWGREKAELKAGNEALVKRVVSQCGAQI